MIETVHTASDPDISVVVPTLPGNDRDITLRALENQVFDGSYEILLALHDGICRARNAGIDAADADVVALTDDDCIPAPDWLQTIVQSFRDNPDLVCLEGPVTGLLPYWGEREYVGCNLSFDRDTVLAIDGFDSRYDGWRDDTEFGWRMEREADGTCLYNPDVLVSHPSVPRARQDLEKERRFKEEYPDRYQEIFETPLNRAVRLAQRTGILPTFLTMGSVTLPEHLFQRAVYHRIYR